MCSFGLAYAQLWMFEQQKWYSSMKKVRFLLINLFLQFLFYTQKVLRNRFPVVILNKLKIFAQLLFYFTFVKLFVKRNRISLDKGNCLFKMAALSSRVKFANKVNPSSDVPYFKAISFNFGSVDSKLCQKFAIQKQLTSDPFQFRCPRILSLMN